MINYLRSENSRSKLQPTSSTASVSEFNKIAASSGLDQNNLNPSSFYSQELKFEIDEVQSPDNSIWESLLAEQIDLGADFLISSPMSSSVQAMHGQSLPGCSPPSCDSFQIDSLSTIHKERGQRPLHKIVNSPTNHFMQPESLALPTMDEYHRDGFKGYPSMKKSDGGCSPEGFEMPTSLPAVLECLPLSDSLGFCGSVNEVETPGGSQNTQESEMQQMGSFAAALLLEEQQQDQQEEENLDHGTLSTGSDQEHDDSNLQLVHLLLACADAVANEDYMSARQNLHHLKRVVTPLGNSIQRLASIFADALSTRLTAKVLTTNPNPASPKSFYPCPPYPVELLRTYQILYQTCPYLKFAHFTANQIIFEAIKAEERVHIIDLSIIQGYQWPAFMQALAARPGGAPFLRITGVGSPPEFVRETGRCLTELAQSLHVPFEFHPVSEQLEDLKPHMFQRRIGEALAVNSVHLLHKVNGKYLGNLLGMIRDQAPTIVALVEQDASHNGPYFMGRFLEALHYYSSLFDSLEATFPADSAQRAKVEKYLFGPQIQNIVGFEGPERIMRHERLEKWRKLMEGNGFKGVPFSANALTQAEMLLSLYPCGCAGYRLTQDKGCLLLGWQDRVLQAASAWRC